MQIAIVHNEVSIPARPDEQDTLDQVAGVKEALRELGHQVKVIPFSLNIPETKREILAARPDLIFNLVESLDGTDSLMHIAGEFYQRWQVPYTGAPADCIRTTSTKSLAKSLMRQAGIPTADWYTNENNCDRSNPSQSDFTAGRFIVKAIREHASVGIDSTSVAQYATKEELLEVVSQRSAAQKTPFFGERFIDGREFNLSVLEVDGEPQVQPPAEILFLNYEPGQLKIVDFNSKWVENSFEYQNTPRCFKCNETDPGLLRVLKQIAIDCWRTFGVRGYARVDFRVDENGSPYVLEINANPCITPEVGFPSACAEGGRNYLAMIDCIVQAGLQSS